MPTVLEHSEIATRCEVRYDSSRVYLPNSGERMAGCFVVPPRNDRPDGSTAGTRERSSAYEANAWPNARANVLGLPEDLQELLFVDDADIDTLIL